MFHQLCLAVNKALALFSMEDLVQCAHNFFALLPIFDTEKMSDTNYCVSRTNVLDEQYNGIPIRNRLNWI